jgi:hypothetical protein
MARHRRTANPDYFKVAGGSAEDREAAAEARRKLRNERARERRRRARQQAAQRETVQKRETVARERPRERERRVETRQRGWAAWLLSEARKLLERAWTAYRSTGRTGRGTS